MFGLLVFLILTVCKSYDADAELSPEELMIQQEIVNVHNHLRRSVQPPATNMLLMNYSNEIEAVVTAWINTCNLYHGPSSTRMLDGYELGENLYYSSMFKTWTQVINVWHSEVANYQYPIGSTNGKNIGHYTQVVWNTSYKVGCALKNCNGIYFYGCQYYRAGNFRYWPPYKAGPPCDSCPNNCEDKLCTNPCPYVNLYSNCYMVSRILGCNSTKVKDEQCPASCKCTTEIIPIG